MRLMRNVFGKGKERNKEKKKERNRKKKRNSKKNPGIPGFS